MIGIVIWSCDVSQRALLWCDDNGPLALMRGREDFVTPHAAFPGIGDLVAFSAGEATVVLDLQEEAPVRIARSLRVVERGIFLGADMALREAASPVRALPRQAPPLAPPMSPPMSPGRPRGRSRNLRLAASA